MSDLAGAVFASFIETELATERDRRAKLDARGVGVLTTSGTLVTLLFALGALVTSLDAFEPGRLTVSLLTVALVAFVIAGSLGLLGHRLVKYQLVNPREMLKWQARDGWWHDDSDKARRLIALGNIKTLITLRNGNERKAGLLTKALWAQLAALFFLAAAVASTLLDAL